MTRERHAAAQIVRFAFAAAVVLALAAGMAGGLLRAGVVLPASGAWLTHAVVHHAFLMICAFMGTVIGIERAVAVKHAAAFAAPAASGAAGLLMLAGSTQAASWVAVASGLAFVAVNVMVFLRQRAAHTALLLMGAGCWLVGNLWFASGARPEAAVPWWFSFLVLTIAAERLEMTRLMRRRNGASQLLWAVLAALLLGCATSAASAAWGGVLYGVSLLCLATWLVCFDIARRTVAAPGLSRYMALCLLLGYGWLAVAGFAWAATSMGHPLRDVALHALGLGFVFSMMLGHAPVILPALARVKLQFGWVFYLPLALLHGTLVVRFAAGHAGLDLLAAGAAGNALSLLLFVATVAGAAIAWRRRHAPKPTSRCHDVAAEN
jgi:hypothetical protein